MNFDWKRDGSIPLTKLGNQVLYIPFATHSQVLDR
jgi:hypothetical protein